MTARTALVLVSHSAQLAAGTRELAGQMAPEVVLVAVGGLPDGGLGTSFDRVGDAVRAELGAGRDVVVLADLGSAMLTADAVIELLEDDESSRVRLADAPFVEGTVAAAVAAQGGGDLEAVLLSAQGAGSGFAASGAAHGGSGGPASAAVVSTVTVRNRLGLHARPAASLARLVSGFEATVLVDGVNGASVLELMKLGATGGRALTVEASGPQAREAVDAVVAAVEAGFGEV